MNHEAWGIVADIYIPLLILLIAFELLCGNKQLQSRKTVFGFRLVLLVLMLGSAFGFMTIDNIYNLWPKMASDYSTHSAVSLVLVVFYCVLKPKFLIFGAASLLFYFFLMVFLQYHTVFDIFSTVFVISLFNMIAFTLSKPVITKLAGLK